MPTLRLVPTSGPPVEIRKDATVVGRDPGCDVVIGDGSVSRKHARIERRGDTWFAVDQASANGTFLDSVRVGESPLAAGQELRFGAVAYRVEIEGGPAPDIPATLAPEPNATVIQPLVAPPPPRLSSPRPPPPPPPPPPVTADIPRPARLSAPPPPVGSSAPPATGAPPISMPPQPGGAKSRTPVVWLIGGGCGCLLLLVAAVIGLFVLPCGGAFTALWKATEEPVAEVRAQLQEIKAGQLDQAYARFSESYRTSVSRADFDALVEAHPALKDNADSTFNNRNVSGDTAELSGSLESGSGAKEAVTYQLVKEHGAWKISALRFAGDLSMPSGGSREVGGGGGATGGDGLQIRTENVQKQRVPEGMKVEFLLVVAGVRARRTAAGYEVDLGLEIEAFDPRGQIALVRQPVGKLNIPTANAVASVKLTPHLTIPPGAGRGTYRARFFLRNRADGANGEHEQSFEIP